MNTLNNTKKPIPLLGIEIENFDEWDYESIVLNFWKLSVTHRVNEFNFADAFSSLKDPIINKLAEHGLAGYELFVDNEEGIYDFSILVGLTTQTDYFSFTLEDAKEAILKARYEKFKETFEGYFEDLIEISEDIENWHGHTLEWKIELFDRIIHAQHETGDIFDDLDIETLREQAEEEIKEMLAL